MGLMCLNRHPYFVSLKQVSGSWIRFISEDLYSNSSLLQLEGLTVFPWCCPSSLSVVILKINLYGGMEVLSSSAGSILTCQPYVSCQSL